MKPTPFRAMAIAIACATACLATSQSFGQDFPSPKPTDAHKLLAEDAGTWDATVKMFMGGPGAPPTEYKGTETVELVCGGLHLRSVFKGKFGEQDFEGYGLLGYDDATKEYVGTWVDSFNSTPTQTRGKYDAEKKQMVTISDVVGPAGEKMKQRQVISYVDAKTRKLEMFITIGEAEMKLMEIVSKKRE